MNSLGKTGSIYSRTGYIVLAENVQIGSILNLSNCRRRRCSEIGWHKAIWIGKMSAMRATARSIARSPDIAARVDAIDWAQATADLDAQGCAVLKELLSPDECAALAALYPEGQCHIHSARSANPRVSIALFPRPKAPPEPALLK